MQMKVLDYLRYPLLSRSKDCYLREARAKINFVCFSVRNWIHQTFIQIKQKKCTLTVKYIHPDGGNACVPGPAGPSRMEMVWYRPSEDMTVAISS